MLGVELYQQRIRTRTQVQNFCDNHENNDEVELLGIKHPVLEKLLEAGRFVCRIEYVDDEGTTETKGTGFYFGNGWIMSNQHVLCSENEDTSDCNKLRFKFPNCEFDTRQRYCIFSHFSNSENAISPLDDIRQDLALVKLKTDEQRALETAAGMYSFADLFAQEMPIDTQVFSIHYADSSPTTGEQCFSLADGYICLNYTNDHNVRYTISSVHSRPGASGAPLLYWSTEHNKFLVTSVNFGACSRSVQFMDSPSYSIAYMGYNWIQKTVGIIDEYHRARKICAFSCHHDECLEILTNLNQRLEQDFLRVHIPEISLELFAGLRSIIFSD
jgi:hypothetical protein